MIYKWKEHKIIKHTGYLHKDIKKIWSKGKLKGGKSVKILYHNPATKSRKIIKLNTLKAKCMSIEEKLVFAFSNHSLLYTNTNL